MSVLLNIPIISFAIRNLCSLPTLCAHIGFNDFDRLLPEFFLLPYCTSYLTGNPINFLKQSLNRPIPPSSKYGQQRCFLTSSSSSANTKNLTIHYFTLTSVGPLLQAYFAVKYPGLLVPPSILA